MRCPSRSATLPLALAALLAGLANGAVWSPAAAQDLLPPVLVQAGSLNLKVHVSRTANLFHIVDQLSAWNASAHAQYRRHLVLDEEDERSLAEHAALRRRRPWGHGLEDAFYSDLSLEQALADAVAADNLTGSEAALEERVLRRFGDRVDVLVTRSLPSLERALAAVSSAQLQQPAEAIARLTGVQSVLLPVFLVASPEGGGGRYAGGRLVVEVSQEGLSVATLLHECAHVYLDRRREALKRIVDQTPGLDLDALGESIAYAFAPGLFHASAGDALQRTLDSLRSQSPPAAANPGATTRYLEFLQFAIALRPDLELAFAEGWSLERLLTAARGRWLALHGQLGL